MSSDDKTVLEHIRTDNDMKRPMSVWPRDDFEGPVQQIEVGDMGAADAMGEALEMAAKLKDLQRKKATELRKQVREIRETCDQFGIDPSEVGL